MARPVGAEGAKTSTLSVRLTPKMRFGLEMMSRLHRETLPDIVTRAINDVFDSEDEGLWDDEGDIAEIGGRRNLLPLLWSPRPSDRLANLAFHCEYLLSTVESRLWAKIKASPTFWSSQTERTEEFLLRDVLAEGWEALEQGQS